MLLEGRRRGSPPRSTPCVCPPTVPRCAAACAPRAGTPRPRSTPPPRSHLCGAVPHSTHTARVEGRLRGRGHPQRVCEEWWERFVWWWWFLFDVSNFVWYEWFCLMVVMWRENVFVCGAVPYCAHFNNWIELDWNELVDMRKSSLLYHLHLPAQYLMKRTTWKRNDERKKEVFNCEWIVNLEEWYLK